MVIGKKDGFSLAEMLVTLGIIGIVAAMAIPSLMKSTTSNAFRTSFKKSISFLNQAIRTNIALVPNADFTTLSVGDASVDGSIANMFSERLRTYRVISAEDTDLEVSATVNVSSASNYTLFLNDGIIISFPQSAQDCEKDNWRTNHCVGVVDVNGIKMPNKLSNCSGPFATTDNATCTLNDAFVNDRFSIRFYDGKVEPNGNSGRAIIGNNIALER